MQTKTTESKTKPTPLKPVSKQVVAETRLVAEAPVEAVDWVEIDKTAAPLPPYKEVKKQAKKPTAKASLVKAAVKAVEAKVAKVEAPRIPMSQQIWAAIKDRELGLFGLQGQTVEKYCTPMDLDPTRCMLKYKVSSVIPALESAVPDFDFEVAGAYLVVSKKK